MTWKQIFTSSIGRKLVMAVTGISLILFLIVHVTVNACMWAVVFIPNDNGEVFNKAAHFLGQTLVPRVLEIGLFLFIILHIIQGYVLEVSNRSKRGTAYAVNYGNRGSTWYSRGMGLLGTLIFLFLIVHIADFWIPSRFGGLEPVIYDGKEYHNLYGEMIKVFQDPFIVSVIYFGMYFISLSSCTWFSKFLHNIGVHNKRYNAMLKATGYAFSIIVSLAFAMMPVSVYFGWVK